MPRSSRAATPGNKPTCRSGAGGSRAFRATPLRTGALSTLGSSELAERAREQSRGLSEWQDASARRWRGKVAAFTEAWHAGEASRIWRASGEARRIHQRGGDRAHGGRWVEQWYSEYYAPFLTRGHNAVWMLLVSGCVALIFGFKALQLQPARHDVSVWPPWHNEYSYLEMRDGRFELARERVHLLWGVSDVDRTDVDRWDEADLGSVVWDDSFDASDPEAQVALLRGCTEPPLKPELMIVNGTTECVIGAFYAWNAARTGSAAWPLEPSDFQTRLGAFLLTNPSWGTQLSIVQEASEDADGGDSAGGGSYRLRHVTASFQISVMRHAPAQERKPLYDAWEAEVGRLNGLAPRTANGCIQSAAGMWVMMAVQELLLFYAVTVVLALAVVGFVVIAIATRSVRLAGACMLTILSVVATFTGFMVGVFGMEPGMIESVVLMVSVGLMLDPLTHVAHAFNEASGSRAERLSAGLTSVGISVLGGTVSTAGSCVCLFFCTINIFLQFGQLLCTLLVVTSIFTNLMLAPLLLLVGPTDEPSKIDQAVLGWTRRLCAPLARLLPRSGRGTASAFRHQQFFDRSAGGGGGGADGGGDGRDRDERASGGGGGGGGRGGGGGGDGAGDGGGGGVLTRQGGIELGEARPTGTCA